MQGKKFVLPIELFEQLQTRAKAENMEVATLLEKLLDSKEQVKTPSAEMEPPLAPIYRIHEYAIDMGITDLAQNLDHYLYGLDKVNRDNNDK